LTSASRTGQPPVQGHSGVVAPYEQQTADGVLDPTFWEGLDVVSQGAVAEALPQPPQSEAEWQHQVEAAWETSPDAPNLTGLTADAVVANGAVINWTTDEPATSQVRWGIAAGSYSGATPIQSDQVTTHSIPLTGLTAGTQYFVQAGSRDGGGNLAAAETQFTTLAAQE
jgi:Purple acid Phosphatase, N-terminal domain